MTNVNLLDLQKQADIRTPEMLLDYALPMIITGLETVTSVEVFQLTRGGMVVWNSENSTLENGAFIPLEAHSLQQSAIIQQRVIEDSEAQSVIAPLINQKETFALLVLHFQDAVSSEGIAEIADDLALLLHTHQINTLLQRQIAVTGRLNIASSLTDVAAIIAQNMVQAQQFIGMNLFEYDENGEPIAARVIATANRKSSYSTDISMNLNLKVIQELHELLLRDGEVLISDIDNEDRFSEEDKIWLREQRIKSLFLIPMWIESKLDVFISISDTSRALAPSVLEKELFHNVAHQAALIIGRQRLLEQSQISASHSGEQVRVLRLLNELIADVNSKQLEKPILQQTADILLEVTGVDHVGVVMHEGNEAFVVSEAPAKGLIGRSIELGSNSIHKLLEETRVPFIAVDVATNNEMPELTRNALVEANVKSVVVLPMFDESDELMGSIGLDYFTKQDAIDPDLIETAQTIVSQIALSLQKVRLLAESQQKAEQLERLTEFGQSLLAYLTVPKILSTTLEYCPDLMQADYVGILTYDRPSNTLHKSATHLHGENHIYMASQSIHEEDDSIALQAWSTHQLVKVDDLHADWEWKHELHRELQSIIAIPLSLAGVTLGVLEIGSATPNQFNATDVTTLRQISNQLAIALSNASAYSQSQRLARNKTQANEIIAKLQEQLEVNDILNTTVNELGKALGAKRARIRLGTNPPIKEEKL